MKKIETLKTCPECGGRLVKHGLHLTRKGKSQKYQCVECALVTTKPKETVADEVKNVER
ncbi:MAG: hypothetical protein V1850_00330 [Candidatus Bathyarchaeota archaeon]